MQYTLKQLVSTDVPLFKDLMRISGEVFDEAETYQGAKPSDDYIKNFLGDSAHIILVSLDNDTVVGGIVAYELEKFEQARKEMYLYDLAVAKLHQRKGVASALVEMLKNIAQSHDVSTIFVQADDDDKGAISFYRTLDTNEVATHTFDITLK